MSEDKQQGDNTQLDMDCIDAFYFVRHGQTDANISGVMCGGEWDIDLNETGVKQAKEAALRLKEIEHNIQSICVSPMKRTLATAEILNTALNVPVTVVEELREWCVGEWSRQPFNKLPNLFEEGNEPPNGEKRHLFHKRVEHGFRQSVGLSASPVLIVSHGAVWHAIAKVLKMPGGLIHNCRVHKVSRSMRIGNVIAESADSNINGGAVNAAHDWIFENLH